MISYRGSWCAVVKACLLVPGHRSLRASLAFALPSQQHSCCFSHKALLRLYMTVAQTPELAVRGAQDEFANVHVCSYHSTAARQDVIVWLHQCCVWSSCSLLRDFDVYMLHGIGAELGFKSHRFLSHIRLTENNQYLLVCLGFTWGKLETQVV